MSNILDLSNEEVAAVFGKLAPWMSHALAGIAVEERLQRVFGE